MNARSGAPVVCLTGASSGIGRAAALQLAERGCSLVLVARREDRLKDLQRELAARGSHGAEIVAADVRDKGLPDALANAARKKFGGLDVLVNNAGILRMQATRDMPEDVMRELFETNFWAPVALTRGLLPLLAERRGHVVHVASGVARRGLSYMSAYSATKFALTGITEGWRLEPENEGVTFTIVYPGGVETEMPARVDKSKLPEDYPKHIKGISAERAARAVVKAVFKRPLEIYVPWWVRPAAWLSVLAPSLADGIVRKARTPKK